MKFFIVHAHHEPKSFNGALTRRAEEALVAAGHEVRVSDLYAMGFDPVSDRRNFTTVADADYLKQQAEEARASEAGGFVAEIEAEIAKLEWCDVLIFQFPLWWFGMPAILKGWVDRVFAMGRVYGAGKWYSEGTFAGKKAMVSMTTGGPESMYETGGLNPPMKHLLEPIEYGVFKFTGFNVLPAFFVWGPARLSDEEREQTLQDYAEHVLAIPQMDTVAPPDPQDYPPPSFQRRT